MARTEIERLGLGRLERLDLKSFWGEQLPDLTPWFLQNIDLLSETLGIDITPLEQMNAFSYLFLEHNKIRDLTPLFNAAKKDFEGEKRFILYVNLFVTGNPLSAASKKHLEQMKEYGARITN